MKPAVIALGIGAAVIGGYVYYTKMEIPTEAAEQENTAAAPSVLEQATEAAEGAATAAADAVNDVVETATESAEQAADAATDAVEATTEAVGDAVEGAADAAQEAATEAVEAATEAGAEAAAVAEEAASAATSAMDAAAGLLTADGFDFDKVVEMISGSSLDESKKMMLTTAVTQAKDNPELLNAALEQVKSALGM